MNYRSSWMTEELDVFRDQFRKFLAKDLAPHAEKWRKQKVVDRSAWKALGDMGALLPSVPEAYGGLGATFALAAVAVGSALGHPAALHPFLAVPLEAVHLLAVAAWLGGVVLLLLSLADAGGCVAAAGRVSALALASTVAVGLSGVLLALLFLGRPAELLQTDYGRLVLAKGAGLAVLVAFGALHRARFIPRLRGGDARPIGRALRLELGVFTLVVLVSGLLAHAPLPVRSPPTPERLLPPPAVRVGQPGGGAEAEGTWRRSTLSGRSAGASGPGSCCCW